jgi:AcrR family transcriptional regulator
VAGAGSEECRDELGPTVSEAAVSPGRLVDQRSDEARAALCDAALEAAGEIGWRRLSVEAIAARAGISRARFYRLFADREECVALALRLATEELACRIGRRLGAAPDPETGFRLALRELAEFCDSRPLLARGLLAEARLAGAGCADPNEVFERLLRATPGARRETARSRHSPPPFPVEFILAALGSAVVEEFTGSRPSPLGGRIDALVELAYRVRRQAGDPG